ncbi:MAG: molybdopterin converting factor subunit 1 [Halopseudomonas sp.]
MISLQLFARYRELLGVDQQQLEWSPELGTLRALRDSLLSRGEGWQVLAEPRLMCALNQDMVSLDTPLQDGDEVAFFPPVTGG